MKSVYLYIYVLKNLLDLFFIIPFFTASYIILQKKKKLVLKK